MMTKPEMYRRLATAKHADFMRALKLVRGGGGSVWLESPVTVKQGNAAHAWEQRFPGQDPHPALFADALPYRKPTQPVAVAADEFAEIVSALDEVRAEISRLNKAAGETVFNPAATQLVDTARIYARRYVVQS